VQSEADTILVTGATGFIGLNLLHILNRMPYAVIGLSNRPLPDLARDSLADQGPMPIIELTDVRDGDAVSKTFARHQPDLVIHAAAVTAGAERERSQARTIVDVNVGGTQSVLDACSEVGVKHLLHVSSGAVYGSVTFGEQPISEVTTGDPSTLYGITKLVAEQLVHRHRELHDLNATIGRLSAAFGPWEYPSGDRDFMSPFLQLAKAAGAGAAITLVRDAPRNWVYAPDAAKALIDLTLVPSTKEDCYNVCPETTMTVGLFAERLRMAYPDIDLSVVDDPRDATIKLDADPRDKRAPVSARRLAAELGPGRWSTPAEACDDYISWGRAHPTWL